VQHRLEVAGAQRPLIPPSLSGRLYRLSLGVPRLINVLCDRALLGAYVQGKERVDRATLAQAAREVFYQPAPWRRRLLRFFSSRPAELRTTAVDRAANETPVPRPAVKAAGAARPRKPAARSRVTESSAGPSETMEWPVDEPRARSKTLAYTALFKAWGTEYPGTNGSPAEKLGLRWRTARGGLDELIKLNRPAVLTLRDRRGREFYATLTELDDATAIMAVGSSTQSIAQRVLVKQWSGDYTMLWRLPPFAQETIWPGEQGPAVLWLRSQLAAAQGAPAVAAEDPLFDEALVDRVKQFQRAHGLIPDGAIGVQALIHLSCMTDRAAPNLSRGTVEK
jgi:general secretion pathway protein A